MEWGIKNDVDIGECSVHPNTIGHHWFCSCSIYKGSSKQNQEEKERNLGGGIKRKEKGWDAIKGILSRLVQNKLLFTFMNPKIP